MNTILPRLFAIFRGAGHEPLTGYSTQHFPKWDDAQFTVFFGTASQSVVPALVCTKSCSLSISRSTSGRSAFSSSVMRWGGVLLRRYSVALRDTRRLTRARGLLLHNTHDFSQRLSPRNVRKLFSQLIQEQFRDRLVACFRIVDIFSEQRHALPRQRLLE